MQRLCFPIVAEGSRRISHRCEREMPPLNDIRPDHVFGLSVLAIEWLSTQARTCQKQSCTDSKTLWDLL